MKPLTTDMLHDLGINKSEQEEADLIAHFETTLNERVGAALLDELDDVQAEKLLALTDKGDEEATTDWLRTTLPNFDDIVQDEYDLLMGELADSADKV